MTTLCQCKEIESFFIVSATIESDFGAAAAFAVLLLSGAGALNCNLVLSQALRLNTKTAIKMMHFINIFKIRFQN